jgi:hypothetical protein
MSDARRVTLKHWPDLWGAQVEYDPNGDWAIIPWEEIERLREELLHEMNANEMKGQRIATLLRHVQSCPFCLTKE